MTVNELIAELQKHADNGLGESRVEIVREGKSGIYTPKSVLAQPIANDGERFGYTARIHAR